MSLLKWIQSIDVTLLGKINSLSGNYLDIPMIIITWFGLPIFWISLGILDFLKGRRREGLLIIFTLLYNGLLVFHLKYWFMRPRPEFTFKPDGIERSPSFPSGHTATAMTGATAYAMSKDRPIISILSLYLLSWSVAFSRMYLGLHYPSDVLPSMLISYINVSLITIGMHYLDTWPEMNEKNIIYRLERFLCFKSSKFLSNNLTRKTIDVEMTEFLKREQWFKWSVMMTLPIALLISGLFFVLFFLALDLSSILKAIILFFDPEGEQLVTMSKVQHKLTEGGTITLLGGVTIFHLLSFFSKIASESTKEN